MTSTHFTFPKRGRVFLYYDNQLIISHQFHNTYAKRKHMEEYRKRINAMKNKHLCCVHVLYDNHAINTFLNRLSLVTDKRVMNRNKELFHERI